jgi:hypothetical protein
LFLGFVAAIRANVARGKDLVIAVRADFADQPVALFFESPMSWNFHVVEFLSTSLILWDMTLRNYQGYFHFGKLSRWVMWDFPTIGRFWLEKAGAEKMFLDVNPLQA